MTTIDRLKGCVLLVTACLLLTRGAGHDAETQRPTLRDELSVNGLWEESVSVPNYEGERFEQKTYRREVLVPSAWQGKRIQVEFRQVNFSAKVFANDQPVAEHVGGWAPFAADVTSRVKAGEGFHLRVEVASSTQPPYVDDQRRPLWPVGTDNHDGC